MFITHQFLLGLASAGIRVQLEQRQQRGGPREHPSSLFLGGMLQACQHGQREDVAVGVPNGGKLRRLIHGLFWTRLGDYKSGVLQLCLVG